MALRMIRSAGLIPGLITTSFSRLFDFRTTLEKIKNETTGNYSELDELKQLKKMYSKLTWFLFYSQSIIFTIGILALSIAFIMIYQQKLFSNT